jgi:hypothetical protein
VARLLVLALLAPLLLAAPAAASQVVTRNADAVSLRVNAQGEALVTFAADGVARAALARGAVNAAPRFELRYRRASGPFAGRCEDYDGPPLPLLVVACKAPDGSYWALQRWQRVQPLRGFAPFRAEHAKEELHLSHWAGPLPELQVSPNWTYGGRWQGLFGRLTYLGVPVFGTRTPSTSRADAAARYVYIDTYNSVYGPGWRRDAAKVTHRGNGAFCFSFVPQSPPPGYPAAQLRGPGNGERHRVTAMGPGVTPIVQWEGAGLRSFDAAADRAFDALFDRLVGPGDNACRAER